MHVKGLEDGCPWQVGKLEAERLVSNLRNGGHTDIEAGWVLPQWLSSKESACNAGAAGSIPESGRSTGGGHGNLLQYSCLEKSTDRGA